MKVANGLALRTEILFGAVSAGLLFCAATIKIINKDKRKSAKPEPPALLSAVANVI